MRLLKASKKLHKFRHITFYYIQARITNVNKAFKLLICYNLVGKVFSKRLLIK